MGDVSYLTCFFPSLTLSPLDPRSGSGPGEVVVSPLFGRVRRRRPITFIVVKHLIFLTGHTESRTEVTPHTRLGLNVTLVYPNPNHLFQNTSFTQNPTRDLYVPWRDRFRVSLFLKPHPLSVPETPLTRLRLSLRGP